MLGVAMIGLGSMWALGELEWDRDGQVGEAIVVEKYVKPSPRDHPAVDSRVVYHLSTARGVVRGELWFPIYMGWEQLRPGDRIELEHLPSGEARLPESSSSAGWVTLAAVGVLFAIPGGAVATALVAAEFRAGRLSWETVRAALSGETV